SGVHAAVVSRRVTGFPAFSNPADRAIEKQAACAAAISSSGLVPALPSNRVANEYGPLKAPLPALNVPLPSLSFPSHTAIALLVGMEVSSPRLRVRRKSGGAAPPALRYARARSEVRSAGRTSRRGGRRHRRPAGGVSLFSVER